MGQVRDAVAAQIRKGRTDLQIARHYTLAEFNLSDAQIQVKPYTFNPKS